MNSDIDCVEYCHVCGIVSREVRGHLVVCCMSDRHGAVSMSSCKNPCASAGYGEHYMVAAVF